MEKNLVTTALDAAAETVLELAKWMNFTWLDTGKKIMTVF